MYRGQTLAVPKFARWVESDQNMRPAITFSSLHPGSLGCFWRLLWASIQASLVYASSKTLVSTLVSGWMCIRRKGERWNFFAIPSPQAALITSTKGRKWSPGIENVRLGGDGFTREATGTSISTLASCHPSPENGMLGVTSAKALSICLFSWWALKVPSSSALKLGDNKTSCPSLVTSASVFKLLPEFAQFMSRNLLMFSNGQGGRWCLRWGCASISAGKDSSAVLKFAKSSGMTCSSGSYDGRWWYSRKRPNLLAAVRIKSRTCRRTRRRVGAGMEGVVKNGGGAAGGSSWYRFGRRLFLWGLPLCVNVLLGNWGETRGRDDVLPEEGMAVFEMLDPSLLLQLPNEAPSFWFCGSKKVRRCGHLQITGCLTSILALRCPRSDWDSLHSLRTFLCSIRRSWAVR